MVDACRWVVASFTYPRNSDGRHWEKMGEQTPRPYWEYMGDEEKKEERRKRPEAGGEGESDHFMHATTEDDGFDGGGDDPELARAGIGKHHVYLWPRWLLCTPMSATVGSGAFREGPVDCGGGLLTVDSST